MPNGNPISSKLTLGSLINLAVLGAFAAVGSLVWANVQRSETTRLDVRVMQGDISRASSDISTHLRSSPELIRQVTETAVLLKDMKREFELMRKDIKILMTRGLPGVPSSWRND